MKVDHARSGRLSSAVSPLFTASQLLVWMPPKCWSWMFCLTSLPPSTHSAFTSTALVSASHVYSFVQAETLGGRPSPSTPSDPVSYQVGLPHHSLHYNPFSPLKFRTECEPCTVILSSHPRPSRSPCFSPALWSVFAHHGCASTTFTLLGHTGMGGILVITVISSCCQQLMGGARNG